MRPAHAEPVTSAIGLLAVGQAVGDFVATDEVPVDRVTPIDWQSNDAFAGWFQQLERSIPADAFAPGREPFDTWLQTRGTAYDLVMTTEADAGTKLADATGRGTRQLHGPLPSTRGNCRRRAHAGSGWARSSDLEDGLRDALADQGYRVEGADAPAGAPALGRHRRPSVGGCARRAAKPVGRSRAMSTRARRPPPARARRAVLRRSRCVARRVLVRRRRRRRRRRRPTTSPIPATARRSTWRCRRRRSRC